MRRLLLAFLLTLACSANAQAQSTTVSATILDANGQSFAGGSYRFDFNANGKTQPFYWNGSPFTPQVYQGLLDNTGSFSGVSIPSTNFISPSGTLWRVTVCPLSSSPCYSTNVVLQGASLNIGSQLLVPAITVAGSAYNQPAAYSDSEINGPKVGFLYFNLTDQTIHECTVALPCTWVSLGSGGGTPSKGPLPSYDVVAYGGICNGNIANVTIDSAAILAAINAANSAVPAGGIINIDNCAWLPPNPLPTPNSGIILQARTGFTVTATLYLQQGYYLQGQPNVGSQIPEFGTYPAATITPSPSSISPVIEVVVNATAGTTIQNIEVGGNFTGVGIESFSSQTVLKNVIATSTSNTAQPIWMIGGFGDRIYGGVFSPGSGSTNPSIRLSSYSATNNAIRDVRIVGNEVPVTMNYQGILVDTDGNTPVASDCANDITVDDVLYENATGSGSNSLVNIDTSQDCVRGITIRNPYISDSSGVAILNTGVVGGPQPYVQDVEIWQPVGAEAPIFAGSNTVGGFLHLTVPASSANLGVNVFTGIIVDVYGIIYEGGSCINSLNNPPCNIIGGLTADADDAATTNIFKRASTPTNANMSLNQRAGETGDLVDGKNSSLGVILRSDYLGNWTATSLNTTGIPVASLPLATSNLGRMITVTDSTSISAEGQTCVGSGTNVALAFSNGVSWKCF